MKRTIFVLFAILSFLISHAATVDTVEIKSISMGRSLKAAVVMPKTYKDKKMSFPVLYLLHGAYGRFSDWHRKTTDNQLLHKMADTYNIIIVTPEGETFSFYLDSPDNTGSMFESHIIKEVIPYIDAQYRTIARKEGRAITGLSMGGHGALYLSTRHPELFAAAGSMSGAVDMGSLLERDSAEHIKGLMTTVFGKDNANVEMYRRHAVIGMVDKMKDNNLPLIIDCGTEDYLLEANRELHRRLLYRKIPHEYTERPGAHTWEYWSAALPVHMQYFAGVFASNGVRPGS
jgi:putative tributyrin esterase